MANDFLSSLRRREAMSPHTRDRKSTDDVLFMIKCDDNGASISTVGRDLKPIPPDYHYYSGDTAQLLRAIDSIRDGQAFQVSWDNEDGDAISLHEYPHLIYQLIRCTNIVDATGHPVTVSGDTGTLQLTLRKEDHTIRPDIHIAGVEGRPRLLTDCFALSDGETPIIYPIAGIGDNYQ